MLLNISDTLMDSVVNSHNLESIQKKRNHITVMCKQIIKIMQEHLQFHNSLHSKHHPFTCRVCNKSFVDSAYLL